jgi:hypothetical protein
MCSTSPIAHESERDDKLSNLTTALVCIERGEGGAEDYCKLEPARKTLIDAIRGFKHSRFALGRALTDYRTLYKQEGLWQRAEKEIATALGCNPRTISRIIEESQAAAGLHPYFLEAMEQHRKDPGKKKNAPVVDELLRRPIPKSSQEANAEVRSAVVKFAPRRKSKAKPALDPIEGFACRIVKLFEGRFKDLSQEAQISELQYCIEKLLASLHTDLPTLLSSRIQAQRSQAGANRDTAAA